MSVVFDFILATPIIIATLLGIRDGFVRKLVALVAMAGATIVAQLYSLDAGKTLAKEFGLEMAQATTFGFLLIFVCINALYAVVYRFGTGNYKIGGIGDKILGGTVGLFQGALLVSVFLMLMARHMLPGEAVKKESRLYSPLVNIAPQILDSIMESTPEVLRELQRVATPDTVKKIQKPQ
jgi:uncharacterized membrane protein required for colicin V production